MNASKMNRCVAALGGLLIAALAGGCQSEPRTMRESAPSFKIYANHKTLLTGETTKIFTRTENLLGRDVRITWNTSLGTITPVENGRAAQFTSDRPGTAVITGDLNVDGRVLHDETTITINQAR